MNPAEHRLQSAQQTDFRIILDVVDLKSKPDDFMDWWLKKKRKRKAMMEEKQVSRKEKEKNKKQLIKHK